MKLLERDSYIEDLQNHFARAEGGSGHVVFLAGESGIGKSSVVNLFLSNVNSAATSYVGHCDSLFTPRPLGPLFDIAGQIGKSFLDLLKTEKDRGQIFSAFQQEISASTLPVILVIEDIHWADEATIDFIKLLGRRIERLRCLLILTYRDNEIHAMHPVKSVFSDIPTGNFHKVLLAPLSLNAVDTLAISKGYFHGDKIFELTGGNPFYVAEVLTNSGSSIPERVKDSILSVFYSKDERVQALWELLSILPLQIDSSLMEAMEPHFLDYAEESVRNGVIIIRHDNVSFKHELFRIAIEGSMSLYRKRNLHGRVLKALTSSQNYSGNLPLLIHHACQANERSLVATLSPQAADEASRFGSHIEAARFYQTAIEFTPTSDESVAGLYARHAYECYLINQIPSAIISQEKALGIWRKKNNIIKEGDALRMLSRHLWFQGRCKEVMQLAFESVRVLEGTEPCRELALAYSNLCSLYMVSDDVNKTIHWGNKALELAEKLGDTEVVAQALGNIGTVLMKYSLPGGASKLNESLSIALEHELHDHVAAAYTNLSSMFVLSRQYGNACEQFEKGLSYCEPRDLNIWTYFMESQRIRMLMDTCAWAEAEALATSIYNNPVHTAVIRVGAIVAFARLKMRRGEFDEARLFIREARSVADPTIEAHTMIPAFTAQLELCWLLNEPAPEDEILEAEKVLFEEKNNSWYYGELAYWKRKCGIESPDDQFVNFIGPFHFEVLGDWRSAAESWRQSGCKYEQALALFEGDEQAQRDSLTILDSLDLKGVVDVLKLKLRSKGVRNLPRGMRESTRSNPAMLTERQVQVLVLLRNGKQNKEIADKLFISSKTVDHHISAILSKLEVSSRSKAVLEAEKLGILK